MKKFQLMVIVCFMIGLVISPIWSGGNQATQPAPTTQGGQWVPDRDFTIRVPFAAGGAADSIARIVGQGLQNAYGRTVIVTNPTGANGTIAGFDLLGQPPRGSELMVGGIAMFTLAPLFNPDVHLQLEDFRFVSGLVSEDFILVVNPGRSGIRSWEDLVAYGRTNRIVYGSNAPGGTTHILGTALFGEAGLRSDAVPAAGSNLNIQALLAGDVVATIATASLVSQHVGEGGSLVPIAVFSTTPFTEFAGYVVPTVQSLGYDIVFRSSNFLMTRAEVDQSVTDHIHNSIQAFYQTAEFQELSRRANYVPDTSDGPTIRQLLIEAADWSKRMFDLYYAR